MALEKVNEPILTGGALRIRRMRLIMVLCLLDVSAPILNILKIFGLSVLPLVNVIQVAVFVSIVALSQKLRKSSLIMLALLFVMLVISLLKIFSISGVSDYNFTSDAVGPYFYSLLMPFFIVISLISQGESDIGSVRKDLYWFSKWYLMIAAPIIVIYVISHYSGRFDYFGFGVNFHYFAPFFFYKHAFVFGMFFLILLTGKRAVLVNFLVQYGLYLLGKVRRSPLSTFLLILVTFLAAALLFLVWGEYISILLRRFFLMFETLRNVDFDDGLLGLANSHESIVLFGGRLEEIVGVVNYFSENPAQIWFGSPPGANYVRPVEQSDFEMIKSFAHLTWLGYIFRYGLLPTGFLVFYLIYLALRGANTQNPLWLVYIGILTSATFGANLFYSPTAWAMIALYVRYGRAISHYMKEERIS